MSWSFRNCMSQDNGSPRSFVYGPAPSQPSQQHPPALSLYDRSRATRRRRPKKSKDQSPDDTDRSKYWCFTLNNYTEEEVSYLQNLGESIGVSSQDEEKCPEVSFVSYLVFGRETGEEGTPHLQGYIEFTKRQYFRRAKAYIGERAHIQMRYAHASEAANYCKKEGDFQEYGTISAPERGKLRLICQNCMADLMLRSKNGS